MLSLRAFFASAFERIQLLPPISLGLYLFDSGATFELQFF